VLVDANMDTWIIDFGSGFTEGWVEKERAEKDSRLSFRRDWTLIYSKREILSWSEFGARFLTFETFTSQ
jgi:hypothetical protein